MRIQLLLLGILIWGVLTVNAQSTNPDEDQGTVSGDSLLEQYSIEELVTFKNYYKQKLKSLESDKAQLRQVTISDAENFIEQHPESKILDKVYMRLAELYYAKAVENYLNAEQAYDKSLNDFDKGLLKTEPVAPKKDFSKSLNLLAKIRTEFPHSPLIDDVIYNIGYIKEEEGNIDEALEIYQKVINEFPDSRYVPESYIRIAEYHFNPPINNIEKAIELFKEVLYFKDSPRYDEALYRLGWSYYRLNMYPEAVAYFTLLADDIERSKSLDPEQKYTNPALRDESVEYIGISFLDYGGVEGAAAYLKDIGGRDYGVEVLQKIGDVYMKEKEEYEKAIQAYQTLLTVYPDAKIAPTVQSSIVQGYRYLENDMMAYLARKALYNNYRPESDWWNKTESEKAHDEARKLTEGAIRENINLLLQRANELSDLDLFDQAVQDSREYLKSFPDDSNAVHIHWNMAITLDVKLKKPADAYDEYMKISDLYWDTKNQKWAAENAIAIAKEAATNADSLSRLGREEALTIHQIQSEIEQDGDLKAALQHKAVEMSEADRRLANAYDNYIMLYPHEKETAIFLANAGALYYNRNQFQKALKYFNTLVRHFPGSEDVDYAKYRIMECYFGNRDFRSSEIVARRLHQTATTPEIAEKANKRLGESIFLNAETLSDSGEHLKAGNEYVRVVVEVPGITFADLALFNGALQYDEGHEYRRAVETYEYLIENYPQSKYRFDAMNNQALDYGELNEFRNAAISYERLASAHPDSERARDALYNSSIFYVRAEDWKSAIRVNKDYVQKYPNSPDADDLYFDIAGYHLKAGEIMEANQIYGEYAVKYPDSPRVVESFFRRGEYFRENSDFGKAKYEYGMAFKSSEDLKARGLETNEYFAAEALFMLTQLKFEEFVQIEFRGSAGKISEAKMKKKELLLELVQNYSNVARFGTIRLYEATYNIGHAYEEFAAAWARQELLDMDETRRVVALKEVNQAAANLYERSVKSFTDGVEVLTRIANDYEAYLKKQAETTEPDSTPENLATAGTGRVTIEDSTLYVAHRWIDRAKEKVSEIIYDIAELNHESVNSFLNAPVPAGLDAVSQLEYRNQVLNRAVRPMIENIVAAHARNVQVAHEMTLQNKWVDMSKRRIVATNNILPLEYYKMADEALGLYSEKLELYQSLTKSGQDGAETSDQMATLIDYSNAFSRATVKLYQTTIIKGREQSIEDSFIEDTENQMMNFAYTLSMAMDSLAIRVNLLRKSAEKLFKETDQAEFEDAIYAYEDNFYSFKESKKALLEEAYNISNEMGIANVWTNQVLFELVKAAPDKYKNLMDLQVKDVVFLTGPGWKTTLVHSDDWTLPNFDDSGWKLVDVIAPADTSTGDGAFIWCMQTDTVEVESIPVLAVYDSARHDSTQQDSLGLAAADSARSPVVEKLQPIITNEYHHRPAKNAYFRNTFEIAGLPVSGQISLQVDDAYNLFLNGEYIAASRTDSTNWREKSTHLLNDYLKLGPNVLAIEGIDTDASGFGMKVVINVSMLPDWAEKQKQFKFRTMNSEEKENLIFNKNIIVY